MTKKSTTYTTFFKSAFKRAGLLVAALLLAAGSTFFMFQPPAAQADRLQDQMDEITRELEKNEAAADHKHREASTLQEAVNEIESQTRALELQIRQSTLEKQSIEKKIEETKVRIAKNQEMLASTLSDLYVDDSMTPLEMLASSNSIGDYVDKQEYRNSVRDQVAVAIKQIKELRIQLDKQNEAIKEVLARQKSQEEQLVAKRDEKNKLLAETRGEEQKYKERVEDLKAEREETIAAIEAAMRSSSGGGGFGNFNLANQGSVSAGTIIGRTGDTGFSFGCHLHWEGYVNGNRIDPTSLLGRPGWVVPTNASVTQSYGNPDPMYTSGYHPGVDYGAMCGAPIAAAADGVLQRGWMGSYGCAAVIDHGGGIRTLYGHFSADSC